MHLLVTSDAVYILFNSETGEYRTLATLSFAQVQVRPASARGKDEDLGEQGCSPPTSAIARIAQSLAVTNYGQELTIFCLPSDTRASHFTLLTGDDKVGIRRCVFMFLSVLGLGAHVWRAWIGQRGLRQRRAAGVPRRRGGAAAARDIRGLAAQQGAPAGPGGGGGGQRLAP